MGRKDCGRILFRGRMKMLTPEMIEVLKDVREIIASGDERFMCIAITKLKAKNHNNSYNDDYEKYVFRSAALTKLGSYIRAQIYMHGDLESWQQANGWPNRSNEQTKQDRLDWIDWILATSLSAT